MNETRSERGSERGSGLDWRVEDGDAGSREGGRTGGRNNKKIMFWICLERSTVYGVA